MWGGRLFQTRGAWTENDRWSKPLSFHFALERVFFIGTGTESTRWSVHRETGWQIWWQGTTKETKAKSGYLEKYPFFHVEFQDTINWSHLDIQSLAVVVPCYISARIPVCLFESSNFQPELVCIEFQDKLLYIEFQDKLFYIEFQYPFNFQPFRSHQYIQPSACLIPCYISARISVSQPRRILGETVS